MGEEVHGDGIGAEGVEHDEIKLTGGCRLEFDSGVTSEESLLFYRGIFKIGEVSGGLCDLNDQRINLEEGP